MTEKSIVQLIALFAIALMVGCGEQEMNYTINGHIDNYDGQVKEVVLYIPSLYGSVSGLVADIDAKGRFGFTCDLAYPHDVYVKYKGRFPLIVYPNQSFTITIDDNRVKDNVFAAVELSGKAVQINQSLLAYLSSELTFADASSLENLAKALEIGELRGYRDSVYQQKSKRYEAYKIKRILAHDLERWIVAHNTFDYVRDLLYIPILYRSHNRGMEIDLPEGYYDFLENAPVVGVEDLISCSALSYLNDYISIVLKEKLIKEEHLSGDQLDQAVFDSLFEMDPCEFQQLLVFYYMKRMIATYKLAIFVRNRSIVEVVLENESLYSQLQNDYDAAKAFLEEPLASGDLRLINKPRLSGEEIYHHLLKEGRRKVIFVDYWSTSCGACIADFYMANDLKKNYSKDDVLFVYLCSRSKHSQWQQLVTSKKVKGLHYLISDKQMFDIQKRLGFERSLPHYAIIDKQGKLRYSGSKFRASNPRTRRILDQLIAE